MIEVVDVVKDGKVELPASVYLPEGAEVRVIVEREKPFENEPIGFEQVRLEITQHAPQALLDVRFQRHSGTGRCCAGAILHVGNGDFRARGGAGGVGGHGRPLS